MDAIALVIFYCAASTGTCGVTVAASFPMQTQCMAQSQMVAAQWHERHPDVEPRDMRISCMPRERLDYVLRKNEA